MDTSPKVPQINLDLFPIARCVEVDRKRSVGRKALRNPPSSTTRGRRRPNIWKDLDKKIVRTTLRYDYDMHQME